MASIFKTIKQVNILVQERRIDAEGAIKIVDAYRNLDSVLKIFDFDDVLSDPEIQALIEEREQARKEKNWDLADKIREQLRFHGVLLKDPKI